ncbi:MAG: RNA recognition motif domain-containing protein [Terriglobia bacterium]
MKKLYVGNLPSQASEGDLQAWFAEAGITVDSVNLMRHRDSNQLRGFGFVEIGNDEEAERAIQALNGKDFLGRNLVVNEARPRREGGGERGGGPRG